MLVRLAGWLVLLIIFIVIDNASANPNELREYGDVKCSRYFTVDSKGFTDVGRNCYLFIHNEDGTVDARTPDRILEDVVRVSDLADRSLQS